MLKTIGLFCVFLITMFFVLFYYNKNIYSEIILDKKTIVEADQICRGTIIINGKLNRPFFTLVTIEGVFVEEDDISFFYVEKIDDKKLVNKIRYLSDHILPMQAYKTTSLNKRFFGEVWSWSNDIDSKSFAPVPLIQFGKKVKMIAVETGFYIPISDDTWKNMKVFNSHIYPVEAGFESRLNFISIKYLN